VLPVAGPEGNTRDVDRVEAGDNSRQCLHSLSSTNRESLVHPLTPHSAFVPPTTIFLSQPIDIHIA